MVRAFAVCSRPRRDPAFGKAPFCGKQWSLGPTRKEERCLAGSTWKHKDIESGATENGRKEILEKLPLLDTLPARIIEHRSGIRPSTRDRHPIIGKHDENGKMFLFNGFGSRGATTIPFYAKRMVDFMMDEVPSRGSGLETLQKKCLSLSLRKFTEDLPE